MRFSGNITVQPDLKNIRKFFGIFRLKHNVEHIVGHYYANFQANLSYRFPTSRTTLTSDPEIQS
jgi:hypothetical protein